MTKSATPRKSTAAGKDFSKAAANGNAPQDDAAPSQFGFQMVDDMTVLERKPVPVFAGATPDKDVNAVMIHIYDFKNLELTTYVQQVSSTGESPAPNVFMRPFRDLNSGYGIAQARAALEQLGGNPPPLEQIPGFSRPPRQQKSPGLPELK
ncbi:MAG: hypothetical protein PW788_13235 [Micavibrio sp.]|nr:hypothetical protein [Micavibrio sp.]